MHRWDSTVGAVLLSFAIFVCAKASGYPFGNFSEIGPAFLPFYLGVMLAVLSTAILLRAILSPGEKNSPPRKPIAGKRVLRVVGVFFSMVAYAFFLKRLGFPITTFLFTLGLLRLAESYRWLTSTLIATAASIGSYVIFSLWLQGQFPKGWLGL